MRRLVRWCTTLGDDVERFMYGARVLCCLPVGRADVPSARVGAVMRPTTRRRYATAAGLNGTEMVTACRPWGQAHERR
jgi:hypothetical protein